MGDEAHTVETTSPSQLNLRLQYNVKAINHTIVALISPKYL